MHPQSQRAQVIYVALNGAAFLSRSKLRIKTFKSWANQMPIYLDELQVTEVVISAASGNIPPGRGYQAPEIHNYFKHLASIRRQLILAIYVHQHSNVS